MSKTPKLTLQRTTARARQAKEAGLELGLYEQDDLRSLLDVLMLERQAFMDARKGVCDRPLKAYLLDLNGKPLQADTPVG
jgi:E3 ubiquitin-protein ligase SHPRH